jgi:hypothetical protein
LRLSLAYLSLSIMMPTLQLSVSSGSKHEL